MNFSNIIVFGLGAIGSNIAQILIKGMSYAKLTVVDFDKVEPRNYVAGTQIYSRQHNGMYKTQAFQMKRHRFKM